MASYSLNPKDVQTHGEGLLVYHLRYTDISVLSIKNVLSHYIQNQEPKLSSRYYENNQKLGLELLACMLRSRLAAGTDLLVSVVLPPRPAPPVSAPSVGFCGIEIGDPISTLRLWAAEARSVKLWSERLSV
jgi:hypothetical protein